ncbi:MAG: hypothetical protein K2U26_01015, partial [Cyclobacteriaceae bacterium]|nr:hypothetical protein [Cyclobacteriaceae bacterium]
GIREKLSFAGALLLILHPVQFVNVLWIFQQCELIHLLMVLMCIRIFIRILSYNQTKDYISFLLLLFFQHYLFPNGIFYSLGFAILTLFHFSTLRSYKLLWWCIAIFAFHAIQFFLLSQWLNENSTTTISIGIITKLHFLLTFVSNSIERFLIPNATLSNKFWMNILPLAIFVAIIWFGLKFISHKKTLWLFIVLMISSSLTISIFRSSLSVIPFYYTSLHLPFIILLIAPIFDQLLFTMRSKAILINIAAFGSIIILLWLDSLGKKIFITRNNLNRLKMEEALVNTGPYFPFDDPALDLPSYITIDGKSSKETAVLLYRQFK